MVATETAPDVDAVADFHEHERFAETKPQPRVKAATRGKAPSPRPKLSARECRALARADTKYKKAQRAEKKAKGERQVLIEKARAKVTLDEWVIAGGWAIKITEQNSGQRFSLKDFLEAGHKVTTAMRKFISDGTDSPRLWVALDKVPDE
jgi:hypothetical protein